MTLTKQGVRDLNVFGPKAARNQQTRRHHNFDKICSHPFSVEKEKEVWRFNKYDDDSGWVESVFVDVCTDCGAET